MNTEINFKLLPKYNLKGENLDDNVEFFAVSEKIGEVLYGSSTFFKNSPLKDKQKKSFFGGLTSYTYENILVGTNGFAFFVIKNYLDNFTRKDEISFDDCTDLYIVHQDNVRNFVYEGTDVRILFANRNTNKAIYEEIGWYHKKQEMKHGNQIWVHLSSCLESCWTAYLSNKLEDEITEKGYISFWGIDKSFKEILRIGRGYITLILKKENVTYNINEIKEMLLNNGDLVIRHLNYEKKLGGLFSKGNEHRISLKDIFNRKILFITIEKLLGYSIN
ncbi:MAG: hypothetical protein Q4A09_00575 [Capnocytophaga felis]|nr:hypothetical protein [Capnocytophaga felis]